jgi:hypothetical protein
LEHKSALPMEKTLMKYFAQVSWQKRRITG